MKLGRRLTAVVAVAALGMAVGCSGGVGEGSGGGSGKTDTNATLRAGWTVGTNTLDPHMQTSEIVGFRFGLASIYDRLFTVTAKGDVKGQLVKSFGYSGDGKQLDLTLRKDVRFRDGAKLDARVVKKNLDRARALEKSPVVKSRMTPVKSVAVTDEYALTVNLKERTRAMPYVLADMAGYIMNPPLFEKGDPATESDGSGAYSVKSFSPGQKLVLVRDRDDYWDKKAAKIARIEHSQIADFQAFRNAVAGGQIDIGQFQPNQVSDLSKQPGLKEVTVDQGVGYDLYLNPKKKPLDSRDLRRAINHAIDRKGIVDALYPGSAVKSQYYREGLPGYDPELEDSYPYDPAKAKKLLARAGFSGGVDLGQVSVSASVIQGVVDVIQKQLAKVGIKIKPVTVDALQIFGRWSAGKDTAMINSSNSGTSPLAGAEENWISKIRNPAGTTPEFDKLYGAVSDNSLSGEEADKAAEAMNRYLVKQAWHAPLVWINFKWVMSDKIQGFSPEMDFATTTGPYDWRYLSMTK